MIYKIAFASSDGENINEHFGAAKKFYIAEIDTEKDDYDIGGHVDVKPSCNGGQHEVSGFAAALDALGDVSAVVAQRAGPGAKKYIEEQGIRVYQIPLSIEQALCLLMEEKQWEVDKWRSHTKN
ncbi:NifB/NifX family molybdenum-iron cluster-binding protein [Ruminococcus albus]|uniref:Dinitrogenase iron-molybdenum cofactor biosynthesis protein n=1 Tax=Ruminococcus albus (strain ATCC 27210 / DSM 20455 / JCM 14654 / NCDO 2250 / 7) TaxID=697329 RepID=E6UE54_RUMA7|nr:NifB/NifX family molybdenum-iron cluster-binding protein [Ruminococcus albus]ADU22919.1 Dinitrogenase iron-molybdenum cofactor biosynthesis protein [Ruminococcus albus 7 = DSM 20455]